jgi:cytochrome c553
MNHQRVLTSRSHLLRQLFAESLAAGLLSAAGSVGAAWDPAAKPASTCVACHTDVEKLEAEAANVPVPAGSALQAGKG